MAFPNMGNHFDRPFLHIEKEVLLRECTEIAIFFHFPGCTGIDRAPWIGGCQVTSETDWPYDHVKTNAARTVYSSGEPLG